MIKVKPKAKASGKEKTKAALYFSAAFVFLMKISVFKSLDFSDDKFLKS